MGALIEATKYLPAVIASGLAIFPKAVWNIFKPKKNKNPELDFEEEEATT